MKKYCKNEDCKVLLGPKLLNLLASKQLKNPIKAMALKCLSQYEFTADEVVEKMSDESRLSPIIQSALKQQFNIKLLNPPQKSSSALINLILNSE